MFQPRPLTVSLVGLLGMGAGLLTPELAYACGGTFCDGIPPSPMPVDQTGEDILFIRDGNMIEAHVRIEYIGDAERFAWMVPLPSVPEVDVGSDPLFGALAAASTPAWTSTLVYEDPDDAPDTGCMGSCLDIGGGPPPPPPDLLLDEEVGSFEVVVLDADDVSSVLTFFAQNNYAYNASAAPIIQQYLDEGLLIAGVKLSADADASEIHPLVFRFLNDEPCVPIRLTRVAARDDMGIRAYFLGEQRWAPSNYSHVVLNPLGYDWQAQTWSSYLELLALAVDEAGGRGFVTEFAGPSSDVSRVDVWQPSWTAEPLESMDAHLAIEAVRDMGFIVEDQINAHVLAALRMYLPVPQDWAEPETYFWIGHAQHPQLIDAIAFDAPGFAAMLDERLFVPAVHAYDLLETWPYLTRLHTMLSPEEMTLDPTFHEVPDLPELDEDRNAEGFVFAGAQWIRYDIPFERILDQPLERERMCVAGNDTWPTIPGMPWARRIEQIPSVGPAQVLIDNAATIASLAANNYVGSMCASLDPGDETGNETGDATGGDSGDTGASLNPVGSRGCACSVDNSRGGWLWLGLPLLLLGVSRLRQATRAAGA
jgi:hypothetical protein